ncbi:FliH/SctL family protein [Legionella dresdenensis]|uniref:Flagellar assembly protein FliH n=1 Tax=Legionella dresdenensis TaxID=450200 RepID=A0ABV8CH09_9GAMM
MADIYKNSIISDEIIVLGSTESNPVSETDDIAGEQVAEANSEIREQAREAGYNIGFQQGYDEGLQQAEQATAVHQHQLQQLLDAIPEAIRQNREHLTGEIADIVLAVCQQYFIRQQHTRETISQQVSQALSQINQQQSIEICLHPQDLALLKQGEITLDLSRHKNVRLSADDALRLGGCVIRSEHGLFDAGIERQIERLKQLLLQIKQRGPHEELA